MVSMAWGSRESTENKAFSERSQVNCRLASWRVAKSARSLASCREYSPSRYFQNCRYPTERIAELSLKRFGRALRVCISSSKPLAIIWSSRCSIRACSSSRGSIFSAILRNSISPVLPPSAAASRCHSLRGLPLMQRRDRNRGSGSQARRPRRAAPGGGCLRR